MVFDPTELITTIYNTCQQISINDAYAQYQSMMPMRFILAWSSLLAIYSSLPSHVNHMSLLPFSFDYGRGASQNRKTHIALGLGIIKLKLVTSTSQGYTQMLSYVPSLPPLRNESDNYISKKHTKENSATDRLQF